ncbi:hypothetical protein F4703DRAFT_1836923 [Phycomyces blakesleeanus]
MQNLTTPDEPTLLYIGNLDPRVTELTLAELFSPFGQVKNTKVISDKNLTHSGPRYGFVEYVHPMSAQQALLKMNGSLVFSNEIKVNWGIQRAQKEDNTSQHAVFVGDLSGDVNDDMLAKAFGVFDSITEARIMWDPQSGQSRGFGFVGFRDRAQAEQAIATMNGERLGARAIRVNWANQKNQGPQRLITGPLSANYEKVLNESPVNNTTVYVGNIVPYTQQQDLLPFFQSYGQVTEIRLQPERGFAFLRMESHTSAAAAIVSLQGIVIHGRPAKLSWGRSRPQIRDDNNNNNNRQSIYNQSTPANGYSHAHTSTPASVPLAAPTTLSAAGNVPTATATATVTVTDTATPNHAQLQLQLQ